MPGAFFGPHPLGAGQTALDLVFSVCGKFSVMAVVICVIVYTECQVYTMAAIVCCSVRRFSWLVLLINGSIHGLIEAAG
jgi:hypothetical protein